MAEFEGGAPEEGVRIAADFEVAGGEVGNAGGEAVAGWCVGCDIVAGVIGVAECGVIVDGEEAAVSACIHVVPFYRFCLCRFACELLLGLRVWIRN